jgi:hypothetical protein
MSHTRTEFQRLADLQKLRPTETSLAMARNAAIGAVVGGLAVLVQILQMGASDTALTVSIIACAISIPISVAIGSCFELYLFLGPQSYPHFRTPFGIISL